MAAFSTMARPNAALLRPASTRRAATPARTAMVVRASAGHINPDIKKDVAKVVDTLSCKDVEKQAVMCRCWRSKTFPACDASHVAHNKETGDNVGPLIVKAE